MNKIIIPLFLMVTYAYTGRSQVAGRNDIIIHEIMCDPTPTVGLPASEWIELHNNSATPFNLSGWRLGDATSISGPMPSFNLLPDSFVIVCPAGAMAAMSAYGRVITVTGFPSLDNSADLIYVQSQQNRVIHAVRYSDAWYGNELKKEGGWSLEMIDRNNPCSGVTNWKASIDVKGGTPGKTNSISTQNRDTDPPQLLQAYATDSLTIILIFNEPMDSIKASALANYNVSDGIGNPVSAVPIAPLFDQVQLRLSSPMTRNKVYNITSSAVTDCVGNMISTKNRVRVGLSEPADQMQVVINEILFNPKSVGTDYVEMYNRSQKIFDLKDIYIANRGSTGAVNQIKQLSTGNYLFFPEDFMVITADPEIVKRDYITQNREAFIALPSMPSFNDDEGHVILLNMQGKIIDELKYDEKWHFKLINNREGVALERIDYHSPTQQESNWHSAATSAGYGTPTYKNSQYRVDLEVQGSILVSPEIVSPDNDGVDDFATIAYQFPAAGYVANITIFDANGRVMRYLERNALCGINGNFRWDGLGDRSQKLPVGIYIVLTDIFNLEGKKKRFKNTMVLARKN